MLDILVIADDLTGALDSAIAFAGLFEVAVAHTVGQWPACLRDSATVAVVNTGTRHLPPDRAAAIVSEVTRQAMASGRVTSATYIFKKIDSRFQGQPVAEIEATALASGRTTGLIAPAIPAMGRIVRNGRLQGAAIAAPVAIAEAARALSGFSVPDTGSDADLDRVLVQYLDMPGLLVGAAGLSKALARSLTAKIPLRETPPLPSGRAFVVIGSRDPATARQVAHLRAGRPDCRYIAAPDGQAITTIGPAALTVLQATDGGTQASPDAVAAALSTSCNALWQNQPFDILIASGGDTAASIAAGLGLGLLRPFAECLPGVVASATDGPDGPICLITKSGSFGADDTLTWLINHATPTA